MRGEHMSGIYEWIRGMVFYLILVTMILNLLPDKKYEKYLRLFTGVVFILLVIGPFADLTGLEERMAGAYERITFRNDVRLLQAELADIDGQRLARVFKSYCEAVELDIASMTEGYGVTCLEVSAVLDENSGSENFGALTAVNMRVGLMGAGTDDQAGTATTGNSEELREKRLAANREISRLKTKIGEYYGLEERKITIRLENE